MDLNSLIVPVIVALVGAALAFIASQLVVIRRWAERELPNAYARLLPQELRNLINQVAYDVAVYVEQIDVNDKLPEIVGDIWDKSKQKLALAVEIAIARIEFYLQTTYGLTIDIPEDVIIELIEKNILENPEIFGARKPVVTEEN